MEDPKSRFIEAATRPFADQAETRLAAEAWLDTRVDGDELQLEGAVRRWENGNPRRRGWWFAYFGMIVLISSAVSPTRFWLAAGLVSILTAWIIFRALGSLLRTRGLMSATASSLALTPVFAGTLLVAALAIPIFKTSGQSWFDRDHMIKADPAMPGWSAYEARIAAQARKEQREALGDGF